MNRTFQQAYHIPGTLTANIAIKFTAHTNLSLIHVSAVASNDSDATLAIGNGDDADGYLAACVIGDIWCSGRNRISRLRWCAANGCRP